MDARSAKAAPLPALVGPLSVVTSAFVFRLGLEHLLAQSQQLGIANVKWLSV